MVVSDNERCFCILEVPNFSDKDAYISDMILSDVLGYTEDATILAERIAYLGRLWDACNRSVKDICAEAGMTQAALGGKFCIPLRTVSDWCRGLRTPPVYVRLMMQQMLGLL